MIKSGIEFSVEGIEYPPLRDYHPVNYVSGDHYYRLECFTMEHMREEYSNRTAYELPPLQGDLDNVKRWVKNMWDAIYNPIWVLRYEPPNKRGWNEGVFDGHHRLRLFDALNANCIWAYVQNISHLDRPQWVKDIQIKNNKAPIQGVFGGACHHCDKTRVKYRIRHKPNHKLMGGKLVCGECEGEIEHPWSGVL
jgi:hypothetical protein